jgi:integrase
MQDMPRKRPPHLHREHNRHGKPVWYVRVGKGPRIRIRGDYGSEEFNAAYQAAIAGETPRAKSRGVKSGTLAWLIDQYKKSAHWSGLAMRTRRARENIFKQMLATAADEKFAEVTRRDIVDARDRRTPFAGANFLKAIRPLFDWAVSAEHLTTNPCDDVAAVRHKTEGHHTWSEDEIERFEKRWPIGTRERLAMTILLCTGLRRGDAVRLGRQHVRDSVIEIRTEKTGTQVFIPVLPELAHVIERSACGDLTYIVTEFGEAFTAAGFGNWFRDACRTAKVPGTAHGLRKAAATRLAHAGCTVAELEAIFGWEGGKMAALYTKAADRAKLARSGMDKMKTSIPAPVSKVRGNDEKS